MNIPGAIAFEANVYKITTLIDGGLRVYFDAGENERDNVVKLMSLMKQNVKIVVMTAECIANYYAEPAYRSKTGG